MKTPTARTYFVPNVTRRERGLRVALGMGILAAVIAGGISAPTAMFAAAMASVYLVMSAIMGIDPVYAATQSVSRSDRPGRSALMSS